MIIVYGTFCLKKTHIGKVYFSKNCYKIVKNCYLNKLNLLDFRGIVTNCQKTDYLHKLNPLDFQRIVTKLLKRLVFYIN